MRYLGIEVDDAVEIAEKSTCNRRCNAHVPVVVGDAGRVAIAARLRSDGTVVSGQPDANCRRCLIPGWLNIVRRTAREDAFVSFWPNAMAAR